MILLRVLSAFCPRGGGGGGGGGGGAKSHCMDLGGKHIFVYKACGKLGASGGTLPRGNFDFGPFIRHNLVEFWDCFCIDNLPFMCH